MLEDIGSDARAQSRAPRGTSREVMSFLVARGGGSEWCTPCYVAPPAGQRQVLQRFWTTNVSWGGPISVRMRVKTVDIKGNMSDRTHPFLLSWDKINCFIRATIKNNLRYLNLSHCSYLNSNQIIEIYCYIMQYEVIKNRKSLRILLFMAGFEANTCPKSAYMPHHL